MAQSVEERTASVGTATPRPRSDPIASGRPPAPQKTRCRRSSPAWSHGSSQSRPAGRLPFPAPPGQPLDRRRADRRRRHHIKRLGSGRSWWCRFASRSVGDRHARRGRCRCSPVASSFSAAGIRCPWPQCRTSPCQQPGPRPRRPSLAAPPATRGCSGGDDREHGVRRRWLRRQPCRRAGAGDHERLQLPPVGRAARPGSLPGRSRARSDLRLRREQRGGGAAVDAVQMIDTTTGRITVVGQLPFPSSGRRGRARRRDLPCGRHGRSGRPRRRPRLRPCAPPFLPAGPHRPGGERGSPQSGDTGWIVGGESGRRPTTDVQMVRPNMSSGRPGTPGQARPSSARSC